MEQVGLNLLSDLFSDQTATPGSSAADPGNQLFRGLLEQSVLSGKRLSPGADERQTASRSEKERGDPGKGLLMMESALRQIGLPMAQLKLPRSAVPELVRFLERLGFQGEEIRSLVASLSDKDGSIRMDRLLAKLEKNAKTGRENPELVIQAKDIPLIGEVFAAMGMGAGKIKEVIEGSMDRKGELSLERLSGALSTALPGIDGKSLLPAILERLQIQGTGKAEHTIMGDPDLSRLVGQFADSPGQDTQKQIREEIGRLLRDKGLPPQEVKTFLETLSFGNAGPLSKKVQGEPDANALLEKVVLSPERKAPQEEGWREKLLQSLTKEKGPGKETLQKNWFQEEGPSVKPSTGDPVKSGEQKPKGIPMEPLRSAEGKPKSDPERVAPGVRRENPTDSNPSAAKEIAAGDLSAVRTPKENLESLAAARPRETVVLPEPLPKILDRMLWMIQGGEQKGRIHISPPELGRLDIDLVVKHGHLQAQLSAENPQVKELLEANLGQLKQHLADMGLVIDRFDVMVGLEQHPFSRDQAWTAGNRRGDSSRKGKEGEEAVKEAESAVPQNRGYSPTQVDMLV